MIALSCRNVSCRQRAGRAESSCTAPGRECNVVHKNQQRMNDIRIPLHSLSEYRVVCTAGRAELWDFLLRTAVCTDEEKVEWRTYETSC